MTDDVPADEIEQFSQESRQQLQARAEALTVALERHTAALVEMRGRPATPTKLFQLNDEVRQATAAWDEAVFDHTGTFPVAIELHVEDDLDEDEHDGPDDEVKSQLAVSVLSRWDLDIIDPAALIQAGQAAFRRMNPSVSHADAAADIGEGAVGQALYAIVHEHGEPWFEMPGVEAVAGHRAYLRRDDDQPPLDESVQGPDQPPLAPTGTVLFSEIW